MAGRRSFSQDERLLFYFTAGLFGVLGLEAYMAHFPALGQPGAAWIPLVFSPVACLVTLITVRSGGQWWRTWCELIMWLAVGIGIAGLLMHLSSPAITAFNVNLGWLGYPPVLAPLSYVLPGAMGLAALRAGRTGEYSPGLKTEVRGGK